MKKIILPFLGLFLALTLSGFGLVENVFKASFWIALLIAAIVGVMIWMIHYSWNIFKAYFSAIQNYSDEFATMETETQELT